MKAEFDGKILEQFKQMKAETPSELAKSLREDFKLDIISLAKFRDALDHLN